MRPLFRNIIIASAVFLSGFNSTAQEISKTDSIKNVLSTQLDTVQFNSEQEIINYLKLTSQLNLSSPAEALFYTTALENKLSLNENRIGKAYIHSYKANYYWTQGIYDSALKNNFSALALFEQKNDTLEIVKQLNNIGEVYKKQKDYYKSGYFLRRALNKLQEIEGQKPRLILVNLGQLYMLENKYDSALIYLNRVLSDPAIDNPRILGFATLYQGVVYREKGDYDSADYYLQKSMAYWKLAASQRNLIETKIELAQLAYEQGKIAIADSLLHQAEKETAGIGFNDLLVRIYFLKIQVAKLVKSKDSLSYYYEKYISAKDSVFNKETVAEVNKLSIQYELSQKEREYYKLALSQNVLANEIKDQNRFLFFLIVVIVCAAVFILLLWRQRNNLLNAHNQLKFQKKEIELKQEEIAQKSLELANLNKELYSLNQNLEKKVMERSVQLNLKNKQIAEFTYFNSHKLRAPVASILGLINVLELSEHNTLDQNTISYLKICAQELDHLIHNLKNILESEIDEIDNS